MQNQPIHTVYGGADLFTKNTAQKLSDLALKSLKQNAATPAALAKALSLPGTAQEIKEIYQRILRKLETKAVEDFRIDFEDGYGWRPEAEEDKAALESAKEMAEGMHSKLLPQYIGIRIKALNGNAKPRALRTLKIFMESLLTASHGKLPDNFVVTLPKIMSPVEVEILASELSEIENRFHIPNNSIDVELMIETPQSIVSSDGQFAIPLLIEAAKGRCRGIHFGTYDYCSSLGVSAVDQRMDHPACEFAKQMMKVTAASYEVTVSDGATSLLPLGKNKKEILKAWKQSYRDIRNSLSTGFYQGWDLHPAQIPVRLATLYSFFRENFEESVSRHKNFVERAKRASHLGILFDDEATHRGIRNYFARGLACGALSHADFEKHGLDAKEIA